MLGITFRLLLRESIKETRLKRDCILTLRHVIVFFFSYCVNGRLVFTSKILQGFAIGNGLTNPALQYPAYPDYALEMGLITQSEHDRLKKIVPLCELSIKLCGTSPNFYKMLHASMCCNL